MTKLRTALTERLEIEHPVIQAPMARCAGGSLAGAVSNAGGFGMIGGNTGDSDWLNDEFRQAGNAKIGVGFITWLLDRQPSLLHAALAHSPRTVMLSFGDPEPYVADIKAGGAALICQVQSVGQAQHAVETGADILVAQGQESGGHGMTGQGVFTLAPAIVDAVGPDVPVLAAGGIADGRGLAASLALGCAGVVVGTRFAATSESIWPESKKAALLPARAADTLRTDVFDILRRGEPWPQSYDARALRNRSSERWHGKQVDLHANLERELSNFEAAEERGDPAEAAVWAGESVDFIDAIEPAGLVVERMVAEAIAALSGGGGFEFSA